MVSNQNVKIRMGGRKQKPSINTEVIKNECRRLVSSASSRSWRY